MTFFSFSTCNYTFCASNLRILVMHLGIMVFGISYFAFCPVVFMLYFTTQNRLIPHKYWVCRLLDAFLSNVTQYILCYIQHLLWLKNLFFIHTLHFWLCMIKFLYDIVIHCICNTYLVWHDYILQRYNKSL